MGNHDEFWGMERFGRWQGYSYSYTLGVGSGATTSIIIKANQSQSFWPEARKIGFDWSMDSARHPLFSILRSKPARASLIKFALSGYKQLVCMTDFMLHPARLCA
jgi:hypothetical protein